MQLREPLRNFFGTADKNALLDKSVYSDDDIKEDKIRLRRERKSLQQEMDEYKKEYKELLRKGAEADSLDRQRIAQQAKMAKKKFKIKKQQYKKNSVVLGTVVTIEGARDLMQMQNDANASNLETVLSDNNVDAQQVQERMMDEMIQFELDMDLMQEVQESLDLDMMSTDLDVEGGEEIEKMEELAAGKMSAEQIDVDEEVQVDTEEALGAGLDSELGAVEDELEY